MGELRVRRHESVDWTARPAEPHGPKPWGTRSKIYFDPNQTGTLLRLVEYAPNHVERAHSHSAAEVIYVTEGEIDVGGAVFGPGDALQIDADVVYGPLTAGANGVKFLLVRFAPAKIQWAAEAH